MNIGNSLAAAAAALSVGILSSCAGNEGVKEKTMTSVQTSVQRPVAMASEQGLEANKRTVLAFYDAALTKLNVDEAVTYFAPNFIQHNPRSGDGVEGFRALLLGVKKQFPGLRTDVKRVFADGDFVILHVHVKLQPEDLGLAIVEIFRLEQGKIVEHWDVRQPMPDTSLNSNGMF
jgi:predicted SnoaL-like aldol condensation-catalyzing enzyme